VQAFALVAALALGQAADPSFDQSLQAHRKQTAGSVTIRVEGKLGPQVNRSVLHLQFVKPSQLRLRVQEAATASAPGSDRTYSLSSSRFIAFDPDANEYVSREAPAKGSLAERAGMSIGSLDEAAQIVLDPGVMQRFYGQFKTLKPWMRTQRAGLIEMLYHADKTRQTGALFRFDAKTKLVREVRLFTPHGHMKWEYTWGAAPKSVSVAAPSGARRVTALIAKEHPPTYANEAARKVAEASLRSYARLTNAMFDVTGGGGTVNVLINSPRFRQQGSGLDWTYDGTTLIIRDRNSRTAHRGAARRHELQDHLARHQASVDPTLWQLVQRRNPLQSLLKPGHNVRLVGEVAVNGVRCDILEVSGFTVRTTLFIRKDNRLIASTRTENLDLDGRVLFTSQRNFNYKSVGQQLEASMFSTAAPPGWKVVPLPKLSK
jgi:hypothetical protein